MSAAADDADSEAFVRAALHALDQSHQERLHVARLLPALRTLVSGHASKQQHGIAIEAIKGWLLLHDSERGSNLAKPAKTGFLRKITQSGMVSSVRWVVLDGGTLSYFSDRAETDLRGVLRLQGARCSRITSVTARRHSFDICGAEPHEDGLESPGGAASPPLNPLNASKNRYVFAADTAAEADEWVAAIRLVTGERQAVEARDRFTVDSGSAAGRSEPSTPDATATEPQQQLVRRNSGRPMVRRRSGNQGRTDTDSTGSSSSSSSSFLSGWEKQDREEEEEAREAVLRWSDALAGLSDATAYRTSLRQLCRSAGQTLSRGGGRTVSRSAERVEAWDLPLRPVLEVDGPWARVQLRAVWERETAAAQSALGTDGRRRASGGAAGQQTSTIVTTKRERAAIGSKAYRDRLQASASAAGVASAYVEAAATPASPGSQPSHTSAGSGAVSSITSPRARIEPSVTALLPLQPRLRVPTGAGDVVREAVARAERAVAEAAAAAARRLWGETPGGSVSLHQLDLDLRRDRTVIGLTTLRAARVETVVRQLVSQIRAVASSSAASSAATDTMTTTTTTSSSSSSAKSPGDESLAGVDADAGVVAGQLAEAASADAGLVAFAFRILRGCSRTTAGGDAYEAVELALRARDAVLLVPESGKASPVTLTVCTPSLAPYAPPPIRITPSALPPAASSASSSSQSETFLSPPAELTIPMPPLSPREEAAAAAAQQVPLPGQTPGLPVFVVADTCALYRVKSLDMVGDPVNDVDGDTEPQGHVTPLLPAEAAAAAATMSAAATAGHSPHEDRQRRFSDDEEEDDVSHRSADDDDDSAAAASSSSSDGVAPPSQHVTWDRGDVALVAAHFRKVFPAGAQPGSATVRVFVMVRPGGSEAT